MLLWVNWIEIVRTSDWKKPLQMKPFGFAFLFFIICVIVGGLLMAWFERSTNESGGYRPGELIAGAAGIGSLYFLYFMLAALF